MSTWLTSSILLDSYPFLMKLHTPIIHISITVKSIRMIYIYKSKLEYFVIVLWEDVLAE